MNIATKYLIRKSVFLHTLIFISFLCFPALLLAMVSGDCSNCHTMHNSKDGSAVVADGLPAYQSLTVDSCVGCHSHSSNLTIIDLGGSQVPIVFSGSEPTYPPNGNTSSTLAGGNFFWVAQGDDSKGHNVFGISGQDAVLFSAPGSSTSCAQTCHTSLALSGEAFPMYPYSGCRGCHLPAHHADDSSVVVDASGGSYRFLGDLMSRTFGFPDSGRGVKGIEADDWEQNPSEFNHNTYAGTANSYSQVFGTFLDSSSIGQFCSGCHGNFHHRMTSDQIATNQQSAISGAWMRHPSDVVLPADIDEEYNAYTVYNPLAPVAKPVLSEGLLNSPEVVPGTDVVTCISCHRPHGSPYPDMLRWNYDNCESEVVNSNCGCFVCHTKKDE